MIKANTSQTHSYLFLRTLKEIITNKPTCLQPYLSTVMSLYFGSSNSEDESIRNIVSESIGRLFAHFPSQIEGDLKKQMTSN